MEFQELCCECGELSCFGLPQRSMAIEERERSFGRFIETWGWQEVEGLTEGGPTEYTVAQGVCFIKPSEES